MVDKQVKVPSEAEIKKISEKLYKKAQDKFRKMSPGELDKIGGGLAISQNQYYGALQCCWSTDPNYSGGSTTAWCSEQFACGKGKTSCYSKYFKFDDNQDGTINCAATSY